MKSAEHYFYRCFRCRREWSPAKIEPQSYLCPVCASAEPGMPLDGVLQIEYDYATLRHKTDWRRLNLVQPGRMWEYPELWPLTPAISDDEAFEGMPLERLESFALPQNSVGFWDVGDAKVAYLDDTRNLTGSFKDRASLLVALKAIECGITEISASSTGNAGTSLAGICARLELTSHIWVPAAIPRGKLLQLAAYGARVYLVDGDYDAAFDAGLAMSRKRGWYSRNTGYNPLTIEGKKSAAFDIFLSLDMLPDCIFVPTGDGVIIAGLFKGFWELRELGAIEKLPRLIAVQAERSDALCRYLQTGMFEYTPAGSVADSINAGAPRNLYLAAHAVQESNGLAVSVADDAILDAQRRIARESGALVEPASAAAFAGYQKLRASGTIQADDRALLLFTGHGLKDPASLERWAPKFEVRSPQQWSEYFDAADSDTRG